MLNLSPFSFIFTNRQFAISNLYNYDCISFKKKLFDKKHIESPFLSGLGNF